MTCLPAVPEGQAYVEPYGLPSPIPEHDGTECLKWDPSLWSHADHFKVRTALGVSPNWQLKQGG